MEDFSGLKSNDSLERAYNRNGGRLPVSEAEEVLKMKKYLIKNKKNDTKYLRDFMSFEDGKTWITNTLDLSLEWEIMEVIK